MDIKGSLEEPPPYTAIPTNTINVDEFPINSFTSHLQYHVKSLPDRIRTAQQARKVEQAFSDASLLDRIVPSVEGFLAELGARHYPVPLATLTLVPGTAVPKDAVLSGSEDMKRRGELSRVVKVSIDGTGKDSKVSSDASKPQNTGEDPSWASGQEFGDWGRFGGSSTGDTGEDSKTLWWRDEEMARRLANYLQPKREKKTPVEQSSVVQAVVEHRIPAKREKRGWGWGKRENAKVSPETPNKPADTSIRADEPQEEQSKDETEMVVTAQEVAFRHENEFGIWESFRGWGIVVAVKVNQ
ncbi:hypothetical protein F4820DRAFT_89879 [Hypoxylon rubiginosum]|uniref:Uncharacterized protein n=1 Tax=Hypoxylon rubiginosum TaxID=110542 RepID=A0ACB9ZBB8_9PEZI|nr:hypothetical protein F4820DRAFT_89879 [Hypoxylon rubiginosum]